MNRSDWFAVALACVGLAATFVTAGWVRESTLLVALALVALVIWRLQRAAARSRIEWPALEARFKELRKKEIAYGWSNHVAGEITAHQVRDRNGAQKWMLFGPNLELRAEAECLFRIAGIRLVAPSISLSARLEREHDEFSRWLWFVVEAGQYQKNWRSNHYSPETGHVETHTFAIDRVLEASAAACVEAIKREEEKAAK